MKHMATIVLLLGLLALPAAPTALSATAGPTTPAASVGGPLFIGNAGQWPEAARFQVWGGGGTLWLAEDGVWMTVVERDNVERANVRTLERFDPERANVQRAAVNLRLSFPGANPHPRLEPIGRLEAHVSYFLGSDPAGWRPDVPVWGGVRYVDLYPGVDLVVGAGLVPALDGGRPQDSGRPQGSPLQWRLEGADLAAVRLRVEGADAAAVDGAALRLNTAAGEVALPLLTVEGANVERANVERANASAFDVTTPFALAQMNPQSAAANPQSSDLLYSTFLGGSGLGGSGWDAGNGIALDAAGRAYVTGWTTSSDFPTAPGAFDTSYDGGSDAFVVKLDLIGNALAYATFLGGSDFDHSNAIAVDAAGRVYVTGSTGSGDFPTTPGAFDSSLNGGYYGDAFVAKLNPAGNGLVYATFLGGGSWDGTTAIAVDAAGRAYVAGSTNSGDFPTTPGAFDSSFSGGVDAFVVKVDPTGSALAYATFLGGSDRDYGNAIAVDATGCAYVTGSTLSDNFPTAPGAFDTSHNGESDAFVVKLNPAGDTLAYATFLGGTRWEAGSAIVVDAAGSAYVTGSTGSSDFPTTPGAFDTSYNGGPYYFSDAFVVKLNPAGSALAYATFLGGSNYDSGYAIAVDATRSAYLTGDTYSYVTDDTFPTTPGAFDTSHNGESDAFVVKLNPAGDTLAYATFLGGSRWEAGSAIAVDAAGRVYVTGYTESSNFPVTPGAFDTSYNGGDQDVFVVKLLAGPPPPPPAILGTIWHDVDGDGTREAGEPGLAGVQVCAEPLGRRPVRCATSGPDGSYTIDLDAAGTYLVTPSGAPQGMQLTTPGFRLPVVVREGQQARDIDFGYR